MNILHDKDADLSVLDGKVVAVVGYGSQGTAQAQCMRDSGINVIIGSRKGPSFDRAVADGFKTLSFADAAAQADVIHLLLPDEYHAQVYNEHIKDNLKDNAVLSCSHGFNILFKEITPDNNIDVIMVAPKAPATEVRKTYLAGFGVPGLIAVERNASGKAKEIALAMAKAEGLTRAGVLECSFEQEACEDLFGEQAVLCGGCVELVKAGFEVLTEEGYPPEMAYFECLHELKLIVDLIYEGGIQKMNAVISNTAEWGEYVTGPKIIDAAAKERMREALKDIQSGKFAKGFLEEMRAGAPNLKAKREELGNHPIEVVGRQIRSMFERK